MDVIGVGVGLTIWFFLVLALLGVWLVVAIFFLLNLRDLLLRVQPQNRAIEPGQVWLNFIPLFNIVWIFVTIIKVRDSLQAEFRSRNWAPRGDFSFGLGLAAAILSLLGWMGSIPGLVCWVIYWVRMSEMKNDLAVGHSPAGLLPAAPGGWPPAPPQVWAPTPPAGLTAPHPSPGVQEPTQASGRTCPACGAGIQRQDAQFCSSCGRPVA